MITVPAKTRRNNLITLVALILFAIALCVTVFVSMRVHARKMNEATSTVPSSTY